MSAGLSSIGEYTYISWRLELRMKEAIARAEYMQELISRGKLDEKTALYHATIQPLTEIEDYLNWRG